MEKNIKKQTVKVEGEKWQQAIDKALESALKKAKIDGFRLGHAPKEVFIKKYGIESVYMDAADLCLQDMYMEVMNSNKDLDIIAQPELDIKKMDKDSLEVEFTLSLRPEVKLGKYTQLDVKKESVKVTKKEIEDYITNMRSKYAEQVIKEGKLETGDIAIIDFEGFKDDVAFEGGKGENYSLEIGSNTFIPGFEEKLIGMGKNEERSIELSFPEDYHVEDLKGKPVVFKVKLNEIKKTVIPELNDEFFEDLGLEGVNSKETLEEEVKKTITTRKEADAENKYVDELLEVAAKNTTVEIPEVMIHEEAHRMVHQYEENLKMQGLTLEQFFKYTNSNEEALMDQMHGEAEKRVKYRLMLEEIVKKEKLTVTEEEADKEATEASEKYNMKKDEFLTAIGGLEMIKYDLEMRKAMDVLKK